MFEIPNLTECSHILTQMGLDDVNPQRLEDELRNWFMKKSANTPLCIGIEKDLLRAWASKLNEGTSPKIEYSSDPMVACERALSVSVACCETIAESIRERADLQDDNGAY